MTADKKLNGIKRQLKSISNVMKPETNMKKLIVLLLLKAISICKLNDVQCLFFAKRKQKEA